jgi:peptidoglycan/LPS O-acetylase OafA/YrhL
MYINSRNEISYAHPEIREYISAIDGLRAISIIAVVVYHLDASYLPGGFSGVDIFFVISGFVVAKSISGLSYSTLGFLSFVARFYRRRILRIVPALLMCLLAISALSVLLIPAGYLSKTNDSVGIAAFFGISNFVLWESAGGYFSPTTEFNPFTHTWSLAVEEQFYFLFPIIAFFLLVRSPGERRGTAGTAALVVFVALCAASLIASAVMTGRDQEFAFYMLATRFWELGVGVLLFLTIGSASATSLQRTASALRGWVPALSLVAVGLLAVSVVAVDASAFPFPWALAPVMAACALISIVVLWPQDAIGRALARPVLVYVGKISYALYLWHFGIIVLFRWTIGIDHIWQQVLAAAASFALASASYRLIEGPIRFSPRLAPLSNMVIIVVALVCIGLAAIFTAATFKYKHHLSLSDTRNAAVWIPRGEGMLSHAGCTVARVRSIHLNGHLTQLIPQDCEPPVRPHRIAVLGDSHAGAYVSMLQHAAALRRVPIDNYHKNACPFPLDETRLEEEDPNCRAFREAVVADLATEFGAGDILFLSGLRIPRFRDQWGESILENDVLNLDPAPADPAIAEEIFRGLLPLIEKGVSIVIEAPKPVFKTAPFRCADWFNARNSYCAPGFDVPRSILEDRRARPMKSMVALATRSTAITVWDPFPVLCLGETCSAFRDGKPLFFDGDHLSNFGNEVLLPSFLEHLDAVLSPKRGGLFLNEDEDIHGHRAGTSHAGRSK